MEIVDGSGWGAPKITHKEMTCLLLAIDCQTLTKKFFKKTMSNCWEIFQPSSCVQTPLVANAGLDVQFWWVNYFPPRYVTTCMRENHPGPTTDARMKWPGASFNLDR